MSENNLNTGTWSIREDGAIVSEFGGFEFLGKYSITDMVVHWESLGLKYAIASKGLFDKFVADSLNMFVSPRLYIKYGRIDYGGFMISQEKDGGEDKAIVDSPEKPEEWLDYKIWKAQQNRPPDSPEPAVVGYEIPLPIDTIEKKHELRIQALEARVKQLEDHLWNYLGIKCK